MFEHANPLLMGAALYFTLQLLVTPLRVINSCYVAVRSKLCQMTLTIPIMKAILKYYSWLKTVSYIKLLKQIYEKVEPRKFRFVNLVGEICHSKCNNNDCIDFLEKSDGKVICFHLESLWETSESRRRFTSGYQY